MDRQHTALSERQRVILDQARHQGLVQVETLAESFNVTPQTIRRDLNSLCGKRLLQRIHGGAVAQDGVENLGYGARKLIAAGAKAAIGASAAALIQNDSSMFINIGTTTEQVAEHLGSHVGMLVITNNLNVVNVLRSIEAIEVMMAGGTVRSDGGIVGDSTVEFIDQFKVDYAVIGASALEEDGTVLDFDVREVSVAQAIIRNARAVILVADSTKFERKAPVRITDVKAIDYFVTDRAPPALFAEVCAHNDVQIVLTPSLDLKA